MKPEQIDPEALSNVMFWVGGMFALMPMLIVGMIVGTTWYLRKKRNTSGTTPPA